MLDYPGLLREPALLTVTRWLLGLVFSMSAIAKMRDSRGFVAIVMRYQILPPQLGRAFGRVLPWVEGGTGLLLVFGLMTQPAAGLAGILLLSFVVAIAINLARGRKSVDCGCSGPGHRQQISAKLVARDCALILFSLQIALWGSGLLALDNVTPRLDYATLVANVLLPLVLTVASIVMTIFAIRCTIDVATQEANR